MNFLQELLSGIQELDQNIVPDSQVFVDSILENTSVDETVKSFIETP